MGGETQLLPGDGGRLEASSILGDPRQRRVLSILLDRSHPMTIRDLGVQLAAQENGTPPSDVTEEDHQPIRVDLHHRCLPKLEAVGWIERHSERVIVAEPLSSGNEDVSLPDLCDSDHSWEAVGALLARPRRQDLVSVIAGQRDRLTLEDLATELLERDHVSWTTEHEDEPALLSTLHHVDLPKLAEVGLIEYDPDRKAITRSRSLLALVNQTDLGDRCTAETDTD